MLLYCSIYIRIKSVLSSPEHIIVRSVFNADAGLLIVVFKLEVINNHPKWDWKQVVSMAGADWN